MTRLFLLLLLFLSSGKLISQNIEGSVRNKTGGGISYATVGYYNHKIFTTTDSVGSFSIKKIPGDSIKVSALGYKPYTIVTTISTDSVLIVLEEKIKYLDNVVVENRKKTKKEITLGFYNKKDDFLYSYPPNLEQAVYIENTLGLEGYIDEIKFRLDRFRGTPYSLRIRLYDIDSSTGLPSSDLLYDQNYIYPSQMGKSNTYSIKNKTVKLPPAGVFVSFQWILLQPEDKRPNPPFIIGRTDAPISYIFSSDRGLNWKYTNEKLWLGRKMGYYVPSVSIVVSY